MRRSPLPSLPALRAPLFPPRLPAAGAVPRHARRAMSERAFQLRVDPLTGASEWVVVEGRDVASDASPRPVSPRRPLLATTSYLDMLNDAPRNAAFHRAIRGAVLGPCHVLDIGAGTGLLSMMAARVMAEHGGGKVTACESYLPMVKLMRKVLRRNGMDGKVRIVYKRSSDLEVGVDLDSRADVLVSEILDSELLGEGLIPTLQHAHDMLLVENPRTVPYRATIYAQLVESTYLWKLHDLYGCEAEVEDNLHLTPFNMERIICVEPKQHAMQCSAMCNEIKLVSEPFRVFDVDFSRRPESQGKVDLQIKVLDNGTVHAIISWWVLQLDSTGSITYSTAPNWISAMDNRKEAKSTSDYRDWCDHWKQCVWFVPGTGIMVSKDSVISFKAVHDDISISYHLENVRESLKNQCPVNAMEYSQLMLSPERVGLYGDNSWRSAFLAAIKNALKVKNSPLCLIADDSVFLTVAMAHLSRTSSIASAFPGLQEKADRYLEAVSNVNHFSTDQIEILGRRASCLNFTDLHHKKVDMLIAEPFYLGNEGALPWQNLRFWKERTLLGSLLCEDACLIPCKGILKACVMSLPDLWRSRRQLLCIEDFDHSDANEILGACGDLSSFDVPCLPYFVWQCGKIERLSNAISVMEFDFSQPIHHCSGKAQIKISNPGICHGFAVWIDWVLDEKNSIIIETGPVSRYWKQGVKLLSKPVAVNAPPACNTDERCAVEIDASFDPSTGDFVVKALWVS